MFVQVNPKSILSGYSKQLSKPYWVYLKLFRFIIHNSFLIPQSLTAISP